MRRLLAAYAIVAALLPYTCDAFTVVQFLNLFNIFIGLYLTATLMMFGVSLIVYFARLGTWPSHRDTAVKGMEWGVAMLFVLVVLVAIVQLFERHAVIATTILALIILAAVVIAIVLSVASSKGEEKKPE